MEDLDRPPTMRDLIALMSNTSTKQDITDIKNQITEYHEEHSTKILKIEAEVNGVRSKLSENSEKIMALETTIEALKQDKLKNNVCISGMPDGWDGNSSKFVVAIGSALGITLTEANFYAYATFNGKFVIASFYNYADKELTLSKLRIKKSLMAEEVFPNLKSNNRININEHLTPFNSSLFLLARKARQVGKLATVSSHGGRIRVKKLAQDMPVIVHSKNQLDSIIDLVIELDSSQTAPNVSKGRRKNANLSPTADDNNNNSNTSNRQKKKHTVRNKRTLTSPVLPDPDQTKKIRQDNNNNNTSQPSTSKRK